MTNNSPKWPKELKLRFLHLWQLPLITISRYLSTWIRGRRRYQCSNFWNWWHLDCPKFWLHDFQRPCSFKRIDVKKQQCKNHRHLYNVGESFPPKHVLLHQERMCIFNVAFMFHKLNEMACKFIEESKHQTKRLRQYAFVGKTANGETTYYRALFTLGRARLLYFFVVNYFIV